MTFPLPYSFEYNEERTPFSNMASLVKMQILGLRSFGPDEKDAQMVAFNSPLTLILGQNGCGKTTIIEALKYATCGELPSNTQQGSGFVHDPKINNRVEVIFLTRFFNRINHY